MDTDIFSKHMALKEKKERQSKKIADLLRKAKTSVTEAFTALTRNRREKANSEFQRLIGPIEEKRPHQRRPLRRP